MTFLSRAALALAFCSAAAAPPASAVVCVDPDDASCQPTIQAGVNAAVVGEVVEVASGLYNEEVAIATAGVVLTGGKGVFIDPSGLGAPAHAITITAANVVIDGIGIRNGDDHGIQVNGVGGVQILNVDMQSPDDRCIDLVGTTPNVVIEGSRLRSCGDEALASDLSNGLQLLGNTIDGSDGVDAQGDNILAERNTISRSGTCLGIEGANAVVTGNRFSQCGSGIDIVGSDPSVTRNTLTNTDGTAIDVEGDDLVVESNPITGAGTGIDVFCELSCGTARVVRNRLTTINGTALSAESLDANLLIEANQISQAEGVGIALETLGANVQGNRVSTAGGASDECLDLDGDGNTISGNSLASCGADGIQVDGDNNTVEENRVSGTGDDGIDVAVDGATNSVLGNQASGASDNGVEVSEDATGTTVTDNQASGLHADYCDGGTGTGGTDVPDDTTGCGDIDD